MAAVVEESNQLSCFFLTQHGYNGNILRVEVNTVKPTKVTMPHSKERINMITKATNHGQLFCATGGAHLTSNDMLTALESKIREEDIKKLQQ